MFPPIRPPLIIHGTADTNAPFADSKKLVQLIGGARLHVIEGADHMMPFTHQEEVMAAQKQFLAGIGVIERDVNRLD